ncbi:tRNA-guanine transglycosylase [Natrinema pellirubrum DSM 15624]|uniref:Queuine tRNA-ribosyltransferase n=1 Tax=Natrinema pellirubrum (strain DSM 15624 / CIP 106293 / JCM 10476 / NCIMB 786 / 157) TaxID=797303 RepID=L0JQ36_NATP1|nr:archaeosine synthase subunit alpha [Natrinema pellirubrum]AGB32943.1 queuine tRNA-ribosyltransferase [Natrinema pellirubrum DSM 15624]ELY75326.1 tRNA-guanine transglycosylase [Natrinema pellirubrum DSM 15624]
MTEYFEVHERDGAARVGELRLSSPRTTPALVDDVLEDTGSLWSADRDLPDGDKSRLTVLPHRAFPGGTPEEVQESFAVDAPDVDYPSVAVVSSEEVEPQGTDAYALSNVQSVTGHGAALVEAVVDVREAIPADTALLFSGVATPRNVALLAYAGVDLFDATAAVVKGTEGRYLTTDEAYFLEDLEELPCSCPACQQPREEFTREDCADHNRNALESELAIVRRRIRDGRLRDYLEGQARQDQWLTAAMRELDDQWGYLEERTPILRDERIDAATGDTLRRVEIQRFADRVTTRYRNRFDNPLVLVPCSAAKPYSESQSHRQFHDAIQWRGHLVSMTSPIGVVPQELETTYPAQHYDTVVTGRWSEDEKGFVAEVLQRYLERNEYPKIVAHVPDEGYRDIVERVEERLDLDITYTVADHPTDDESLANLAEALSGELKYSKREREHNTVRALADYLLGDGAGDDLFEDIRTTSRYPKIQVRDDEDTQLATMVPQYGTLSFTLEGAKRWLESAAPTKRVEIDGFVPHGSVLAPGVIDADDDIRVGDEVIVEGPQAFAVGRAEMFGREMAESTRGVACEVRHVEEK